MKENLSMAKRKAIPAASSSCDSLNFPCIFTISSSLNLYHEPDWKIKFVTHQNSKLQASFHRQSISLMVFMIIGSISTTNLFVSDMCHIVP